jgi:hypothetical protein
MWLKAPIIEKDKDGKKRNIGGGKGNSKGTPQWGLFHRFCPISTCTFWTGSGNGTIYSSG